jgi:hypothetical protein
MDRTISLEELLADETPEVRDEMRRRGREAVKAETLRRLRELAQKNQDEIAGLSQQSVSRMEMRDDMLLSSLNTYVRGLGGRLKIVAELPAVGDVDLEITKAGRIKGVTGRSRRAAMKKAASQVR